VTVVTNYAGGLAPGTPLNEEAFLFSYPANDKVTDFLSDYLHKIAEAEVISHELVRTHSPQSYVVRTSSMQDCSYSCHALWLLKHCSQRKSEHWCNLQLSTGRPVYVFTSDCTFDAEITPRVAAANSAFQQLRRANIWSSEALTLSVRMQSFQCNVISVLLYSRETWAVVKHYMKP